MNNLKAIIAANRVFFTGYILMFLGGLIFLLSAGKAGTFLYLNPYHASPLDVFFTYFTWLGDGVLAVALVLLFAWRRRYPEACELLLAFLLSALLAQIFKNLFSMPRPREFFNNGEYDGPYKHFIRDVTLHGFSSFPSGHSTSIFTVVTMLAILDGRKRLGIVYLALAVAVGYSRIYLGQHFLPDVLFGSVIGLLTSVLVHWLLAGRFREWTKKWPRGGSGTRAAG